MKSVTWLLLSLAAASAGVAGAPRTYSLEVGSPFPVVALPSIDGGDPLSIADFRGRRVVLHTWASW